MSEGIVYDDEYGRTGEASTTALEAETESERQDSGQDVRATSPNPPRSGRVPRSKRVQRAGMQYPPIDILALRTNSIQCPHKCGWQRSWTIANEQKVIDHPLYGPTKTIEVVQLDIRSHDCTEYHNAIVRIRRATNGHSEGIGPSTQ